MPWEFHARCPDCHHDWCGLESFTWLVDGLPLSSPAVTYACPQCYLHLRIPTDFDRVSFLHWVRGHQETIQSSRLIAQVTALILERCDKSHYLFDYADALEHLICPDCDRKLHKGHFDTCSLVCPPCKSERAQVYESGAVHVSTMREISEVEAALEEGLTSGGKSRPLEASTWERIQAMAKALSRKNP